MVKRRHLTDSTSQRKTIQEKLLEATVMCTLTESISDVFVYWSRNPISQFDKHPVQLNKYNMHQVETHQVSYSTCQQFCQIPAGKHVSTVSTAYPAKP